MPKPIALKKPRELKPRSNRTVLSFHLEPELVDDLRHFAYQNSYTIGSCLEDAITEYLKARGWR